MRTTHPQTDGVRMIETQRIGVLTGDGVGPEVVPPTVRILEAALDACEPGIVTFVPLPMGLSAIEKHGAMVPEVTLDGLRGCRGWIMGPHDSASYPSGYEGTPNLVLRTVFRLVSNVRPLRVHPGVPSLAEAADLVIVRENTEGFYSDRNLHFGHGELMVTEDVAITIGVFTRRVIRQVVRDAFVLAASRRGHVTVIHKANVLPRSTGMFLEVAREIAADFPDVEVDDLLVDAAAAALVRDPARFDVIVTENLFGDILSDLGAELCGSLGLSGSLNAGADIAMAQAGHGAAPDIAGRGIANPVGMIMSGAMLLQWLGARAGDDRLIGAARAVENAVDAVFAAGVRTADVGGTADTAAFASAVLDALAARPPVLRG